MNIYECLGARRARERGASLLVVLLILIVITLIGLASIRGTLLRERMSGNMYDRSLAFQSAESALREAEVAVRAAVVAGNLIGVNCSVAATACPIPPVSTYTGGGAGWVDGTATQAQAAGRPQYFVQYLGQRESTDELQQNQSANANQYGGGGGVTLESFYRIIARSHDPAAVNDRAVVVLQSNITVR